MATGTADSPSTLFGPVSLGLGVVALVLAFVYGAFAILVGSLAVTFGILGLVSKQNQAKSVIGLVTGAVGVIYPVFFIFAFTGGF